jgi:hypothetical protein
MVKKTTAALVARKGGEESRIMIQANWNANGNSVVVETVSDVNGHQHTDKVTLDDKAIRELFAMADRLIHGIGD